jgi:AraC-like DNA-binding protein
VLAYLPEGGLLSEGKAPLPRPLLPRQTLSLDAPLADVVEVLTSFACCFVALEGSVVGVIGRRDMEKPIVRMWLFGMILLVEMTVVGWIRDRWAGAAWAALVGEARLEKARQLLQERRRRNVGGDLLDCLQLSDELQLALKAGPSAQEIGFSSASAAKRVVKEMESLRNNLAHGQDITVDDWPQIARMSRRLHQLLRR